MCLYRLFGNAQFRGDLFTGVAFFAAQLKDDAALFGQGVDEGGQLFLQLIKGKEVFSFRAGFFPVAGNM